MPTVNQTRLKLKRELETKQVVKELRWTSNVVRHGKTTQEKTVRVSMEIWDNPHPSLELQPEDVMKKVWIAGKPSTFEAVLASYKKPGDEKFPEGGYVIRVRDRRSDRGIGSTMNLFYEEVILHPDELDEERLNPYFTIEDGRRK